MVELRAIDITTEISSPFNRDLLLLYCLGVVMKLSFIEQATVLLVWWHRRGYLDTITFYLFDLMSQKLHSLNRLHGVLLLIRIDIVSAANVAE